MHAIAPIDNTTQLGRRGPLSSTWPRSTMIAAVRAALDAHPRLTFFLVAIRAGAWFTAGHPIILATTLGLSYGGLAPTWALGAALIIDALLIGWSKRQRLGPRRLPWLWVEACRFRRLWPVLFNDVDEHRRSFTGLLSSNRYNGPGGLRPVLAAPLLSLIPVSLNETTVEWAVLSIPTRSFLQLAAEVEAIAELDSRLAKTQLQEQPSPIGRGRLSATFVAPLERIRT